jgi:uncharacterized protein
MEVYDDAAPDNLPRIEKRENNPPVKKTMPTPDNPPWNIWAALGVWLGSVVFIVIFPNLVLLPYLTTQQLNFTDSTALTEFIKTDPTAVLLQVLSIIPAHLCTILLCWLVVTNFRKYSFRQTLGWDWNGFKVWHSFVVVVLFFGLALIVTSIFGESDNDFQQMLRSSRMIIFPVAFLAIFTAPIVEEVVYRGILYSALQRRLGIIMAVVVVTFLFGLVHVPQYSKNFVPDYPTVSMLFLLSLTLTMVRVYTKNLLPCIVLHMIFNAFQSMLLIFEPYLRTPEKTETTASFFYFIK